MAVTWIAVNEAYVLGAMPTGQRTEYDAWLIANPARAGRLAAIVAGVVSGFRDGVDVNPAVVMDPDTTKVPDSCVRHVLTISCYLLALEIGSVVSVEAQLAFEHSEIYRRWLSGSSGSQATAYERARAGAGEEEPAEEPRPSYSPGEPRGCVWDGY